MLTIDLQRLCTIKGIDKPYGFLAANGFTHHVAHTLASGSGKSLRLDHLERLCRLFHCMPHDLLNYKPTSKAVPAATDLLLALRKKPLATKGLQSLMALMPPEEIIRVSEELEARYLAPVPTP